MSIWASIDAGEPTGEVAALDNTDDTTYYRGEGTPNLRLDVATTGHHNLIRLAIWTAPDLEETGVEPLLTAGAARMLADRLVKAARLIEQRGQPQP